MENPQQQISARVDAWRKTGNKSALWPNITTEARVEAQRLIAAATRAALNPSVPRSLLETNRLAPPAAIGIAAYTSGMGPLLGHWIAEGRVRTDSHVAELLREHLEQGRRRAAMLAASFAHVVDACGRDGVTLTVLKGWHTSHVYFPGAGTRPCADIDVLIRPGEFERAGAALQGAGFTETRRTRRPPRSEWAPPGRPLTLRSLELDHAENPWSIDLHQSLDRWYFRGLRAGFEPPLWKTVPLETGAGRVHGLAQPLLTAFLAMHAAFGVRDVRLLHLIELVFVIRHDVASGSLRWHDLQELLAATGTARFAYPALELAERLAPGTVDADVRKQLAQTSTARTRRVVDAVAAAGMQLPRRTLDEKLMWACGARELLCNIGDLVWPSDEALPAAEVARLYLRRARMLVRGQIGLRSQAR